jgi:hypothetical protein
MLKITEAFESPNLLAKKVDLYKPLENTIKF